MRVPLRWTALCLGTALVGCHWVFPFDSRGPVASDGAKESGTEDGRSADVHLPHDGTVDLFPDGLVDPCQQLEINPDAASCGEQCLQKTATDADCDGLPGERDPQGSCNRLLVHESFNQPSKDWTSSMVTPVTQGCGEIQLTAPQRLKLTGSNTLTPKHLVEVKLTLAGNEPVDHDWDLGIWTGDEASSQFACTIWRDPVSQTNAALKLYCIGPTCKVAEAYTPTASPVGSDTVFYLQTYHDGTAQRCRLLSSTGHELQEISVGTPLPAAPGTVAVETNKYDINIDHIWIFEVN